MSGGDDDDDDDDGGGGYHDDRVIILFIQFSFIYSSNFIHHLLIIYQSVTTHTVNMHTEVSEIRNLILKNTKSLQMQGKNALMVMIVMMV